MTYDDALEWMVCLRLNLWKPCRSTQYVERSKGKMLGLQIKMDQTRNTI